MIVRQLKTRRALSYAAGLAVICALAVNLAGPTPARAATAKLSPCAPGYVGNPNLWWRSNLSARWSVEFSCPSLTLFRASAYSPGQPSSTNWFFPEPGKIPATVTAVEFDLAGSDGSETNMTQGVRVCSRSACSPLTTPSGPSVETDEHHLLVYENGDLPPAAEYLEFRGSCLDLLGCQPARPLELRNLTVEIEDNDQPTVGFVDPPVESWRQQLSFSGWNSGLNAVELTAADPTSGVKWVDVRVGDRWSPFQDFGCGSVGVVAIYAPCANYVEFIPEVNLMVDLFMNGMKQGANKFEVKAYDAAGNISETLSRTFLADNIRPQFNGLSVTSANQNGWQSSRYVNLAWTNTAETIETSTQSGIAYLRYDLEPVDSGVANPPEVIVPADELDEIRQIEVPSSGLWRVAIRLQDRAGNRSLSQSATVGVDPVVPDAPPVHDLPLIGLSALASGVSAEWSEPENATEIRSGICGYATKFDSSPSSDPGDHPDRTSDARSAPVPEFIAEGSSYFHVKAISCAGVPGSISHLPVQVDSVPPEIAITEPGSSGWYSETVPLEASWMDSSGGTAELRTAVDGDFGEWSSDLSVPVPVVDGVNAVRVEAKDAAGNTAVREFIAKVDLNPPTAEFLAQEAAKPTLLVAASDDSASGVKLVEIAVRSGGSDWRPMEIATKTLDASGTSLESAFRIPDFEWPQGRYEFQVTATDHAGHSYRSSKVTGGGRAVFNLPLRRTLTITAGFPRTVVRRRCKRTGTRRRCWNVRIKTKRKLASSATSNYGATRDVHGWVADANGNPMAGMPISVFQHVLGSSRQLLQTVTSTSDGTFTVRLGRGPSRRIDFGFDGSETHLPSKQSVRFLVRSRVSLKVSRRRVRSGGTVKFRGRVTTDGARVPRSGLPILIEFRSPDGWKPFRSDAVTDRFGRYAVTWRFGKVDRPLRYRFRTRVRWVDGWAYEAGVSPSRILVVG